MHVDWQTRTACINIQVEEKDKSKKSNMRKKGVFERQQLCVNIRNRGLRGVAGGRLRPELCLTFSSICPDSVLFFYHPLSNTHTHTSVVQNWGKFKETLQSVEFWTLVRDEALTVGDILRSWGIDWWCLSIGWVLVVGQRWWWHSEKLNAAATLPSINHNRAVIANSWQLPFEIYNSLETGNLTYKFS